MHGSHVKTEIERVYERSDFPGNPVMWLPHIRSVEAWWLFGRGAGPMLRSMLTIDGGELWYHDDRY